MTSLDSYSGRSSTTRVAATALLIILLVLPVQKGALSTEMAAEAMVSKSIGAFDYRTCLLLSQPLLVRRHLWNTLTTDLPKAQAERMKPEEAKRLGVTGAETMTSRIPDPTASASGASCLTRNRSSLFDCCTHRCLGRC